MNSTEMYCIYHSRDLDGWMSAAIVMLWYEREHGSLEGLTLIGWDYGDEIPEMVPDVPVIICDVSFSMNIMDDLAETNELTWIDHHKSAINDYEKYREAIGGGQFIQTVVTPQRRHEGLALIGACELTWGALMTDRLMPHLVELLGCYDSFRHKGMADEERVFAFQYAARAYMSSPESCLTQLRKALSVWDYKEWLPQGRAILQYLKVEAKSIYAGAERFAIKWQEEGQEMACVALAINRSRFNPSSYDIDYHADGAQVFVCYHRKGDGQWVFSLYNEDGDTDVSVIAKLMGGGGHAGAAGFVSDNIDFITK
jgi:hypothetical protein